jgi:hypothetical protein
MASSDTESTNLLSPVLDILVWVFRLVGSFQVLDRGFVVR